MCCRLYIAAPEPSASTRVLRDAVCLAGLVSYRVSFGETSVLAGYVRLMAVRVLPENVYVAWELMREGPVRSIKDKSCAASYEAMFIVSRETREGMQVLCSTKYELRKK